MNRDWKQVRQYREILLDEWQGIARITINRPHVRNAFTPLTTEEMGDAMRWCNEAGHIRVVILTGADSPRKEGQTYDEWMATNAFCSGGDMNVKGRGGYIDENGIPRLTVLDVQKQIRSIPKPVIAMVNGFAVGGGHVLHVVWRIVGQKKAREIWYMCRLYTAREAEEMGMVNKVVPHDRLEDVTVEWAQQMMQHSPLAMRMIKRGLNAELDGQAGIQELAGDATMLYYFSDEAQEGGKAFLEKRKPQW